MRTKKREKIERLHERYLKWVLGVKKQTPGYILRVKMERDKLKEKAGIEAWEIMRRNWK